VTWSLDHQLKNTVDDDSARQKMIKLLQRMAVADPEVLARGSELRGHKGGVWGGGVSPPQKFFEF